ncbi:fimbria major subunit, partial [uncultured Bacteroides sp.]
NAKGKYGVVRNHVYAANIHSLVGLGTPVYDPEEVIYPEKPGGDDTYIAAEIRILSWRIVNQNIDLEW